MGTKGREIVGLDVDQLVEKLNAALADEWLAFYQYWVGAQVVKGPMRGAVEGELVEHAQEEFEHAGQLVERIVQLAGVPLLSPRDWYDATNCGYEAPEDGRVVPVLEQNIAGEQCAIETYQELAELTRDTDPITYDMVVDILEDEVEHEEDLQALLEDIEIGLGD
ncbi:MAG: ferritin-like domain-containing protein [Armatimonadota bacterium]